MSEFLLILVWLAVGTVIYGIMPTKEYVMVHGKTELRETWFWAIFLFIPIIYMAGTRGNNIGDTYAYKTAFANLPDTLSDLLSYVPTVKKDKGFSLLSGIIKVIFGNNTVVYFMILAAIQGGAIIYVFRKYSTNYLLSVFLFIASSDYISWMYNGIRQFVAVTIIFAATPWMLEKKWAKLIAVILLASTIHGSALLMLPVVFIVQGKAWNRKTILVTVVSVATLMFVDQFTNVLETLLSDTQYTNVVSDWENFNDDGTNPIRVLVYSIPAIISFVGRKWISVEQDDCANLCTNMSIISAALYVISMGTSGIFIGRLPIYTSMYGYILLPYMLDKIFTKESTRPVKFVMIALYLGFYYFQIHFSWGLI